MVIGGRGITHNLNPKSMRILCDPSAADAAFSVVSADTGAGRLPYGEPEHAIRR